MALLPPYYNRELFSKHFLEKLLPQRPEWAAAREVAPPILTRLRDLRARIGPSRALREQQLEQKWIRPVLEALGVTFDVQVALPTDNPAVTLAPDYAVFGDPTAHQAARALQQSGRAQAYFEHVRMLGDAKRWGTNFGSAAKGQKTPRQQLNDYLLLTSVSWGRRPAPPRDPLRYVEGPQPAGQ